MQKVNAIEIARALHKNIDMGDEEFRDLLKALFPNMPSYHIDALVSIAKKPERRQNNIERLSKMLGGIM